MYKKTGSSIFHRCHLFSKNITEISSTFLSIEIWICESSHERVRTNHFLCSNSSRKLTISSSEFVNLYRYNIRFVVKFNESFKSLTLEYFITFRQNVLLYLCDGVTYSHSVGNGGFET